jgi:predicted O-methyltransferase YrrM
MTTKESLFLLSNIKKSDRVLEYGSGYSTLEISKNCKFILSIEHDEKWYNDVTNMSKDLKNVEVILKKTNLPYIEGGYNCGTYDEFKDYINAPFEYEKFDFVFIDGRARVECSKYVKNFINDDSLIFVHDFSSRLDNHNYKEMYNYLELIESVGDMSKFKIKNERKY